MDKNSAIICSKSKKQVRSFQTSQLFLNLCQVINTILKFFLAITFKSKTCLNRRFSMKTIYLWPKVKQLIALNQKKKQNRMLVPSYHFKT